MGDRSAIEWTDATFNPWWGCQRVSPACLDGVEHLEFPPEARRG